MALDAQTLRADANLAQLSDEQIAAITTLSQNDENRVLATRIGELHGSYDRDILASTGIEKAQGEKTYDYLKRAVGELKTASDGLADLRKQVSTLKTERDALKKQVDESGGDPEIAIKYEKAVKDLEGVKNDYRTLKKEYDAKVAEADAKIAGMAIESELRIATSGLEFDPTLPPTVIRTMTEAAVSKVKGMKSEFIDDGKGGKTLAFLDENGAIMRNTANGLNPFTASELIRGELAEVLKKTPETTGAGTKGNAGGGAGAGAQLADLTAARTQVEADEIIIKTLMDRGLVKGSTEFTEEQTKMREEANVAELPLR